MEAVPFTLAFNAHKISLTFHLEFRRTCRHAVWRSFNNLNEMRSVHSHRLSPLTSAVLQPIWTANKSDPLIDPLLSTRRSITTQLRREDLFFSPALNDQQRSLCGANTATEAPTSGSGSSVSSVVAIQVSEQLGQHWRFKSAWLPSVWHVFMSCGAGGLFSSEMASSAG